MTTLLSNREQMLEDQKNMAEFAHLMPKPDRNAAKLAMGTWIADYLDDAGYDHWETQAPIYKTMFMTAFPPIDSLDDVKPDYATMPIDEYEDRVAKFLLVLDNHLGMNDRHMKQ